MKKLLLLAGLLAIATSTFGQGTIIFGNTSTTLIRTNDLAGNVGLISGATGAYHFELLVAPWGTTVTPSSVSLGPWVVMANAANNPFLPGRFLGGTPTNTFASAGGPMAVIVRGWLAGNPFFCGQSGILQLASSGNPNPTPSTPPVPIFGPGLLQGFDLVGPLVSVVPEPSTVALGLLGVGALVMFRRRKH